MSKKSKQIYLFLPKFTFEILYQSIAYQKHKVTSSQIQSKTIFKSQNGIIPGIHEMFKPSFLKYSIYFKMPIGIPLWKTNTGQKRSFFFGPKISSKISPRGCNRIPIHSHLVRKRTFKQIPRPFCPKTSLKFRQLQSVDLL